MPSPCRLCCHHTVNCTSTPDTARSVPWTRFPPPARSWQPNGGSRCSSSRQQHAALPPALAEQVPLLASLCFTPECQRAQDTAFLIALAIPLVVAAGALAYVLRPVPEADRASGRVFEDGATGTLFEAPDGVVPETDKDGKLAYRAISYTPWPVADDFEGERLRIDVGKVGSRQPRTYAFSKVLPQPSELVAVTLPRPLGIVFEYDERRRRTVAVGCVEGSNAEQRRRVAGIDGGQRKNAILDGDVLRAVTATNFVYQTRALFGAVPPERHLVLYGADGQRWASIRAALRKGEAKDGDVTLVLERRVNEL